MNEWWPIIVMLAAALVVVMIVRRLERIETKIDRLVAAVVAASIDYRERVNDRRQ